jgi:hypothetical protein
MQRHGATGREHKQVSSLHHRLGVGMKGWARNEERVGKEGDKEHEKRIQKRKPKRRGERERERERQKKERERDGTGIGKDRAVTTNTMRAPLSLPPRRLPPTYHLPLTTYH